MVSHVGVRNALGIPKWGWVAGYEWSVDSGHDDNVLEQEQMSRWVRQMPIGDNKSVYYR